MKLTFKMTGEEYFLGWNYRRKKGKIDNDLNAIVLSMIAVTVAVAGILRLRSFLIGIIVSTIVLIALLRAMQKKSVVQVFNLSRILSDEHTIKIHENGIEVLNSYEKVFSPWKNVFAVKETRKNIIILPMYRKGIYVINKKRYASEELNNILSAIKANLNTQGGKI